MKLGKIFICINILVLSLLMLFIKILVTDLTSIIVLLFWMVAILWKRKIFSILLQSEKKTANTTIHACESIEARIPQYQNNYSVTPKDSVFRK